MRQSNTLPTHPTLIHPVTGLPLRAVYVSPRTGRTWWPVLGAAEGDGGDGDDDGTSSDDGDGDAKYTPPTSQAEFDEAVEKRLARQRKQYGMTADEAKAYKKRSEELEHDLSSETDKAVKKAKDEAAAESAAKNGPRLVRQAFKAEAKGVLSSDQLEGLLEDFNPANYLDDDGDVDEEKISARIKKLAAKKDDKDDRKPPSRRLGQGNQPPAGTQKGDLGKAEGQRRFGTKQQ